MEESSDSEIEKVTRPSQLPPLGTDRREVEKNASAFLD
jgi:hypothetical protein